MSSFEDIFPAKPYEVLPKPAEVIGYIKKYQIYTEYPLAKMDDEFVAKIEERFEQSVLDMRVDILAREMKQAGYSSKNFSEYAMEDVAKSKRIKFFIKNEKLRKKITKKVLRALSKY